MDTAPSLERAIDRLYEVFAPLRPSTPPQASPYTSITAEQANRLLARPLRELSKADLDRFARSALATWGVDDDFKYFLPRIFELIVRHPGWGDAVMFVPLERAKWQQWPDHERTAVRDYLEVLWRRALDAGPEVVNAGIVLRGIGLAGEDIRPWLDTWRASRGREATLQIARLVMYEERDLRQGSVARYWHPKDRDHLLEFLREPETLRRLEHALQDTQGGDAERDLADAAQVLASLQAYGAGSS